MKEIFFTGCGGLYHYYFGVSSVIQKEFDLSNIKFRGTSAGCYPALILAMNTNIDDIFYNWNLDLLSEINQYKLGSLFSWNSIVRKHTLNYLPNDISSLNGKLHCHVTEIGSIIRPSTWKTTTINNWEDKYDLTDCLTASSFVPLFDTKLFYNFRNKKCLDGSLLKYELNDNTNRLTLHVDMWRNMKPMWYWCYTDVEWAEKLYQWGKKDAMKNLEQLNNFFNLL